MKPRKMQPATMWVTVDVKTGRVTDVFLARDDARTWRYDGERVVRVRVTEAP